MELLGLPLLIVVATATVLAPVATVIWWRRTLRGQGSSGLARPLVRALAIICCQLLAVALTFVVVNRSYGFYTSWSDLFGLGSKSAKIEVQGMMSAGGGSISVLPVTGRYTGTHADLLTWLPPGYDSPANAKKQYPVLLVLPGQPSGVATMYNHFDFGSVASQAIQSGQVQPFVAVFAPLMVKPPRDTECTDILGGPQAESWLSRDVPDAIRSAYRVSPNPRHWGVAGWSTGGFCAAKLLFRAPGQFSAAAGLGGYYQPITDNTTGNLFRGSRIRYDENSPLWLYQQHGMPVGHSLLMITGREDPESWPDSVPMLTATRGDKNVYSLVFPTGGHNYRNYRDYLGQVLGWFYDRGVLVDDAAAG